MIKMELPIDIYENKLMAVFTTDLNLDINYY